MSEVPDTCVENNAGLHFELGFMPGPLQDAQEAPQAQSICLLCQHQDQPVLHSIDDGSDSELCDAARSIRFTTLGLEQHDLSVVEGCQLQLRHNDTCISVAGHISWLKDAQDIQPNAATIFDFHFDEPESMQARMVLQLVKICQMKTALDEESNFQAMLTDGDSLVGDASLIGDASLSDDFAYAAKEWTKSFAEHFAKDFDRK